MEDVSLNDLIKQDKNGKFITIILFLYTISLVISKFGISLFGGILTMFSIIYVIKNKENSKYNLFIFLFLLGAALQIFSLGGIKSSINFMYKNLFLLITPFIVRYLNEKKITGNFLRIIEVSLFIGILKSFHNFYKIYNLKYTSSVRVDSFFDIMRWGIVLAMCLLLILPNLYKKNIFSWIVFISGLVSLVLNNSRGPFLSLILGIFLFLILEKKIKTIVFILFFSMFVFFISIKKSSNVVNEFHKRITSISKIDSGGNGSRIFMWKENINFMFDGLKEGNKRLFYMGTGVKNREELFKNYIEKKEEYINLRADIKKGVSFTDSHNMYINMFTQLGIIYSVIYYTVMIFFSFIIIKNYFKTKDEYILSYLTAIIAFYFCGIFYGYPFTYETFLFFFIYSLGLSKEIGEKNDINIRS